MARRLIGLDIGTNAVTIAEVTAVRTSVAIRLASPSSPACLDSTASAKDSRPLEVFHRTATAFPARTPSTVSAIRSMSVG